MRAYARSALADDARQHLIAEHIGMARRIARRLARSVPAWIGQDDLISAALVGLAEAADRYDATHGEPFVAFAEKRIRGAVLDELRRGDILPRRARSTARKVGSVIRELEQKLARRPEDEEIAKALDVSVEEYREELQVLSQVSFVEVAPEHEEDGRAIRIDESSPAFAFEKKEMLRLLQSSLERLDERDALVLSLYYVEEFTYTEIGSVLGVSESRVCQLHSRALTRLRAEFDAANAS